MCVCTHARMCGIFIYVHTRVYIHMCICIYAYICVYAHYNHLCFTVMCDVCIYALCIYMCTRVRSVYAARIIIVLLGASRNRLLTRQ
jgi:hypothetical protein